MLCSPELIAQNIIWAILSKFWWKFSLPFQFFLRVNWEIDVSMLSFWNFIHVLFPIYKTGRLDFFFFFCLERHKQRWSHCSKQAVLLIKGIFFLEKSCIKPCMNMILFFALILIVSFKEAISDFSLTQNTRIDELQKIICI